MPLFCGDYLGDTMHLSLEEHGAYLKLLMITWRNAGQALPDDDKRIARMLGVTVARWTDKLRPVIAEFFDLSAGTWRNERLEKEWKFVEERAANSRANGAQGGRPKSQKTNETENPVGSFQATQKEPTHPHPHNQEEESPLKPPRKRGSEERGSRLPSDFVMPEEWIEDARKAREKVSLPRANLEAEVIKFTNHWLSQSAAKGRKADWHRTWINWALNARGEPNARQPADILSLPVQRERPSAPPPKTWIRSEA